MDTEALQISEQAIKQARLLGMYGQVEDRLLNMARRSVPFGGTEHNRRFEGYLILIEDGVVTDINTMEANENTVLDAELDGEGAPEAYGDGGPPDDAMDLVECLDCHNDGQWCGTCNGTGKITKSQMRLLEQ